MATASLDLGSPRHCSARGKDALSISHRHPSIRPSPPCITDGKLFFVWLSCSGSLPSLDDVGPEARRNASLPAPLAVRPAHRVRSFERIALTRSTSRTPSVATFPVAKRTTVHNLP